VLITHFALPQQLALTTEGRSTTIDCRSIETELFEISILPRTGAVRLANASVSLFLTTASGHFFHQPPQVAPNTRTLRVAHEYGE